MVSNKIIIQIGKRKVGKTEFCKKFLKEKRVKRALILDFQDEYDEYKVLSEQNDLYEKFILNSSEKLIYRIFANKTIEEWRKQCDFIFLNFSGGLIIIENLKFIYNKFPNSLIPMISVNKTKKIDIIINFNSYDFSLNQKLIVNSDFIIMYQTNEFLEKYKIKLKSYDLYELFKNAQKETEQSPFFGYINLIDRTIRKN